MQWWKRETKQLLAVFRWQIIQIESSIWFIDCIWDVKRFLKNGTENASKWHTIPSFKRETVFHYKCVVKYYSSDWDSYRVHISASATGMLNVIKVTDFSLIRLQNSQSCLKVISWSLETAVCGIVPLDCITLKGVSNMLSTSVSRLIYLLLSWVVTVQTLSSAQSAHPSLESLSG